MLGVIQRVRRTFSHGVHPPEHKRATEGRGVERLPFPNELVLPLSQHIGAPSRPVVGPGDRVARGQLVAEPGGFVSTSLHAPATGEIVAIELRAHPNGRMMPAIVLRPDPFASQRLPDRPLDFDALAPADRVRAVQGAGIVGLGGAAFPTHVKLSVPDGKRVTAVVINGCECEPYLTCDHRVMVERPDAVLRGTELIMRHLGAERGYVGIERNKPDAIAALRRVAPPEIDVIALKVKYPQGAEKMLIEAIFGRRVPNGGLPLDLEMVVNNAGTAAAIADLFDHGTPLIERVITVTGPGVAEPKNLLVPIGTSLSAVLAACGGLTDRARQVVLGGPMMGQPQKTLDVPVLKGTSGILCLDRAVITEVQEYPCIRCGRCLDACPMFLNPTRLARLVRADKVDDLEAANLMSCFECASCSFVCPSGIPLVQYMRIGKSLVREAKR